MLNDELPLQDLEFLYVRLSLDAHQAERLRHLCLIGSVRPSEFIQDLLIQRLEGS